MVGKGTSIFLSQIKVVANVLYWSVALLYKLVVKEKNNATSNKDDVMKQWKKSLIWLHLVLWILLKHF